MNYWQECVSQSLNEHGVSATAEQIAAIAKDMSLGAEMHGEAMGYTSIPSPHEEEIKRLKESHKRDLKEAESREDLYRAAACDLAKANPHCVGISNGEVVRWDR